MRASSRLSGHAGGWASGAGRLGSAGPLPLLKGCSCHSRPSLACLPGHRTERRAKEAAQLAGSAGDLHGVSAGTYVQLHVRAVPANAAWRVCERVAASLARTAPPLVAFGLLQHECKLSVLNFGVRAVTGLDEPIKSKEPLLLVTGLRGFVARPIYSSDEHGADKHKMERFLHDGR